MALALSTDYTGSSSNVRGDQIGEMSRDQLMKLIYSLMLLVGRNMSEVQKVYAESQISQGEFARKQADATESETHQYVEKMKEFAAKQAEAKTWQTVGDIAQKVCLGLGILAGALLSEFGVGVVIMAAVMIVTTTPAFQKLTDAAGDAIGKAIGNPTWGKIIFQVATMVVLTVATCGAEAAFAAVKAGTEVGSEVATEVAEKVAGSFKFSFAAGSVMTQMLTSSNLVQELLEQIPACKNSPIVTTVIATLANLAIALASFKFASVAETGGTLLAKIADKCQVGTIALQRAFSAFSGVAQLTNGGIHIGAGWNQVEQSEIQNALAPLEAGSSFGQGFMQLWTQLTNVTQKAYQSTMESNKTLFTTNFSADWQACVEAQH